MSAALGLRPVPSTDAKQKLVTGSKFFSKFTTKRTALHQALVIDKKVKDSVSIAALRELLVQNNVLVMRVGGTHDGEVVFFKEM